MQQWTPTPFELDPEPTWGPGLRYPNQASVFVGQESVLGADLYYAVVLQTGTADLPELPSVAVKRIDCIKIISALPMEALEEVDEALSDISQFYMMRQQITNAQCLTTSSLVEPKVVAAKFGRTYDREDFYVSED